ncbi:MAG: biotin--[acetyl-CoA-carboxylase] ligase [Pseudomonadota bacterium]|nr:biotin--[acetyl-CoA-carboxylase] ligase [Pseudomonadota bacterium]
MFVKPLTFDLLRVLTDGEFHSGEKLACELGVSRASIRQAVQPLDRIGVTLNAVRGRGYRIREKLDWLDPAYLHRKTKRCGIDLQFVDSIDSTNRELLRRLHDGRAAHGSVLAAEWQSGGRGRFERRWQAAVAQGLMFSLAWRFATSAGFLAGLSLAIGVALVRALRAFGCMDAGLKWPNDVLIRKHKLAGILIELSGDALGPGTAIIGVGLNVVLPDKIKARIGQPAADLTHLAPGDSPAPSRNPLFARLLDELVDVLDRFEKRGFPAFREEWQRMHAFQNQTVRLDLPGKRVETGVALGVTAQGALRLRTATGEKHFHSGELYAAPNCMSLGSAPGCSDR